MSFFIPKSGVDVPGQKEKTRHKPIVEGPEPEELIFPMKMHAGAPARVKVKSGDRVKVGTLLGEGRGHISANIHSSVSGRVTAVEERPSFKGQASAVVVENDGQDEEEDKLEPLDGNASTETFFARLQCCGLTGKGGAGFPTHVKFAPVSREGHRYMLINGAECEPYSTTDHRVMLEYPEEILRTAEFMRGLCGTEYNVVAVEEDKQDAIERLRRTAGDLHYNNIDIRKVESRYPKGDEGILARTVFGLEIPHDKNPNEVGVLTSNVSTIKAVHDAVFLGRPLVERVITVTGPAITNPQNVLTRIGTPIRALIDFCGGFHSEPGKLVKGGPMMGMPFSDLDIPAVKDTTTILCLGADAREVPDEKPCIRCAKCVDVCPVNLQPISISNAYRSGDIQLCADLKAESCIRCGCCTYICPSKIPLLRDIKSGVKKIGEVQRQGETGEEK